MNKDQIAIFIRNKFGITLDEAKQQINELCDIEIIDEKEYLEILTKYSDVMKDSAVTFEEFNALIMQNAIQENTYPVYND